MIAAARTAAAAFFPGGVEAVTPLGCGNINDTFLVSCAAAPLFVLQRLNRAVFPDPVAVVENSFRLADLFAGQCGLRFAAPLQTDRGGLYSEDARGDIWRALRYIPCRSLTRIDSEAQGHSLGAVLGRFHDLLSVLKPGDLSDPLPGFHDIHSCLAAFDSARSAHPDRLCRDEREMVARLRPFGDRLTAAHAAGILSMQGIHGDPKCDNFIFEETGIACGLLDFDTVGIGLRLVDLGDCLRSCCNRAGEQGSRPPRVDAGLLRAVVTGYCTVTEVAEREAALIWDALLLLSFELGLRFLTDHLEGNLYFRVAEDGLNLRRAQRQFALAADILSREKELRLEIGRACSVASQQRSQWRVAGDSS